ncbi:MAG: hypothetical protein ACOCU4_08840 [Alkalispirochaeta sp.]
MRRILLLLGTVMILLLSGCEGLQDAWEYSKAMPADATEFVEITDATVSYIDSVWLVYVAVTFENTLSQESQEILEEEDETLKYITINARAYDRVDDILTEDIRDYTAYTGQYAGPLAPGESETVTFDIGYFTGAEYVEIELEQVETMSEQTITAIDAPAVSTKEESSN